MDKDFFLIKKMKNGDENSMDIFVRKYYGKILSYCCYHSVDREQAENLTQDTFVKFFGALPEYRHSGKAMNYLYTIAKNLCADRNRKDIKEMNVTLRIDETAGGDDEAGKTAGSGTERSLYMKDPADDIDRVEKSMDIRMALDKIPKELEEVIVLYYFQDLEMRSIAEILGIGLPLVKYRMKKAREELKKLLRKEGI